MAGPRTGLLAKVGSLGAVQVWEIRTSALCTGDQRFITTARWLAFAKLNQQWQPPFSLHKGSFNFYWVQVKKKDNNLIMVLVLVTLQGGRTYLASCFSASAQSSRSPISTADTSIYGSHTVKPRPIRSIAVLRMVLWGGSLGLGGCNSKKVKALPVIKKKKKKKKKIYCIKSHSLNE